MPDAFGGSFNYYENRILESRSQEPEFRIQSLDGLILNSIFMLRGAQRGMRV